MTKRARGRPGSRAAGPLPFGLLLALLLISPGVATLLRHGDQLGTLLLTGLVAVVAGTGLGLVPRFGPWFFLLGEIVGTVALAHIHRPLVYMWIGPMLLGEIIALQIQQKRQPQPPAQLRMLVEDGADLVETVDPDRAIALSAVEALDGGDRTVVSVFRADARLDVTGDAGAELMVYQCDDITSRSPSWFHLAGGENAGQQVEVAIAQEPAYVDRAQTTTLGAAVTALDAFWTSGGRAPGLPWRTGQEFDDLRPDRFYLHGD